MIERDPTSGETTYTTTMDTTEGGEASRYRVEAIDLEAGHSIVERFRIRDADPLSARAEVLQTTFAARGTWRTSVDTRVALSSTRTEFRLQAELTAREGGTIAFRKRWDRRIPRKLL